MSDYFYTAKPKGRQRNRPLVNYSGKKFNRLTALRMIERDETPENNHSWEFRCDCGSIVVKGIKRVRAGLTKSCGCLFREVMAARNTTHGLSKKYPHEYAVWKWMRGRCLNSSNYDFKHYGGRGIKICKRWDDFAAFIGDMGTRPPEMTIERNDVNGDYEPGNCRWATAAEQARNKRNSHKVTYNGVTKNIIDWYGEIGGKIRYRLAKGWPIEKAMSMEDFRK